MRNDWWSKVIGVQPKRNPRPRGAYVPSMHDKFHTPAHGSGYTHAIDWNSKTVTVKFYDHHKYEYDWTDIEGTFTERYGGVYMLGF